jgi:hypothetical protein
MNYKLNDMKRIIIFMFAALICYGGCKEEGRLDHIDDSAPAPAQVTVKSVSPIPGGAVIHYTIPKDVNLLAVKAVYDRGNEICETKASLYCDSLIVEGLRNTNPQEVKLYSIGRNEKLSEPLPVNITPLAPPVEFVKFDIESTFGGIKVSFNNNITKVPLALVVLIDSLGDGNWMHLRTFYAEAVEGVFMQKELESKESKFALHIRDRWLNNSDTVVKMLTPVFETKLSKNTWMDANFPGDANSPLEGNASYYGLRLLWNGEEAPLWGPQSFGNTTSSPMPQHITINLGYRASISSFRLWPRQQTGQGEQEMYRGRYPRIIELWGADNPPAEASFDHWTLLGRWEVFKPSGYEADGSVGTITSDDKIYFENNQMYNLEPGLEWQDPYITVTHVRLRTVHSFGTYLSNLSNGGLIISEMTLFGQPEE